MSRLPFPAQVISQHTIALGKTRSGKSSKLRLIVEHLLDTQVVPVCIVDPKGDWWGLRASADGRRVGYEIVIFGGEHADVPINARSGAAVAELVATGNRPAIIDLGGWTVADRTRFFIDFAQAFFKHAKGARYLVIDEVHNFAPQARVQDPQSGMMLHWCNRLASEGAGRGITLLSASQRPQKVHKDYVTSHETLIANRVIHPLDRKAMQEWMDGCGDPAHGRAVVDSLASLKRSEAWVWSPEAGFGPERITFPLFKTYDSFKEQAQQHRGQLKGWASVDLGEVTEKLAAAVEEAKANDPAELRKQIAELTRKLNTAPPTTVDQDRVYSDGYNTGKQHGYQAGVTEQLEAAKLDWLRTVTSLPLGQLQEALDQLKDAANRAHARGAAMQPAPPRPVKQIAQPVKRPEPIVKAAPGPHPLDAAKERAVLGAERVPLGALVRMHPAGMSEASWAVASGLKRRGGTWKTYVSRLRSSGRVERRGNEFYATAIGIADLGAAPPPMPPPGRELVEFWAGKIDGAGPMLKRIADAYPDAISHEQLAQDLSLTASGGTFKTYLSRLRSPGLIETTQDQVKAAPTLMG